MIIRFIKVITIIPAMLLSIVLFIPVLIIAYVVLGECRLTSNYFEKIYLDD